MFVCAAMPHQIYLTHTSARNSYRAIPYHRIIIMFYIFAKDIESQKSGGAAAAHPLKLIDEIFTIDRRLTI